MIDISTVWPGWQIEELIGQGAYGKVYRIRKEELGTAYYAALKDIEIPADDAEVISLQRMGMDGLSIRDYYEGTARSIANEIQIMESLKSAPNIVHVEEHTLLEHKDSIGWTILIRMELLESLRVYEARAGYPDLGETVKIGKDICAALSCCEGKHIIHRDVKPDNIFRSEFGDYKLGDFGIARQMENTKSVYSQKGTTGYMAPEVNRGEKYDNTVDLYSLGIMLYQYLNKQRLPFVPTDTNRITPQILEEATWKRLSGMPLPAPVDAPPALAKIILKACDANPSRRYRNAEQFRKALEDWESGKHAEFQEEPSIPESNLTYSKPVFWGDSAPDISASPVWQNTAESAPVKETMTPEPHKETVRPAVQTQPESVSPAPEEKKKNPAAIIIIAAAAALVLIAVLIARGRKTQSPKDTNTASQITTQSSVSEAPQNTQSSGSSVSSGLNTIRDGVLTLATDGMYSPFIFMQDDGNYTGIDYELAERICEELDLSLEMEVMDFESLLTAVNSGSADIAMSGLEAGSNRSDWADFSDPYYSLGADSILIVAEDSPVTSIHEVLDSGHRVGVINASIEGITLFDYYPDSVIKFNSGSDCMDMLQYGEIDAVFANRKYGTTLCNMYIGFKTLDCSDLGLFDCSIAVSKNETELLNEINRIIAELRASGELQKIIAHYQ